MIFVSRLGSQVVAARSCSKDVSPSRGQVPAQAGNMTRARGLAGKITRIQENKNMKNEKNKNIPPVWVRSLEGIPNSVGILPTSSGLS